MKCLIDKEKLEEKAKLFKNAGERLGDKVVNHSAWLAMENILDCLEPVEEPSPEPQVIRNDELGTTIVGRGQKQGNMYWRNNPRPAKDRLEEIREWAKNTVGFHTPMGDDFRYLLSLIDKQGKALKEIAGHDSLDGESCGYCQELAREALKNDQV